MSRDMTLEALEHRLLAVRAKKAALEESEARIVQSMREAGATWPTIGTALKITAEAAIYRYSGGRERRQARKNPLTQESSQLPGESLPKVALREGVSPVTLRKRVEKGDLPQYQLVHTTYRGRPATRVIEA